MTLSINLSNFSFSLFVPDFIFHSILLRPVMQTPPTMWLLKVLVVAAVGTVQAASRDQWLSRSVYQVVTDRFARSDNSTTASCEAALGNYCGGSFQGIIHKLDYIQELGFDAVWISPVQSQESTRTADLAGIVILTIKGYRELTIDE
jgi:alpha-amylase